LSKIWFSGDWHLGHLNRRGSGIIKYCNRPFECSEAGIKEMDRQLIENVNACVAEDDTLFNLGDVCFKGLGIGHYRAQIKCRNMILIVGNHDLWRAFGVLGIHLLFEDEEEDYISGEDHKTHHPAAWAHQVYHYAGWGDIELDQLNERRFNQQIAAVNGVLELLGEAPLEEVHIREIRGPLEVILKRVKKEEIDVYMPKEK